MPRPGGVLANIAEAGRPEAVIPLHKLPGMMGSVNDKPSTVILTLDGRKVAEGTMPHVAKILRTKTVMS